MTLNDMVQRARTRIVFPRGSTCALMPVYVLLAAAVLFAAAALGLDHASRTLFGPTAAWVNVRWSPDVDEAQRQLLERQFQLVRGTRAEETTYVYLLTDTSTLNIRELVTDPQVLDTHHIDRSAFALSDTAARVILSDPIAQQRSRRASAAAAALWRAAGAAIVLALLVGVMPVRTTLTRGARLVWRAVYGSIPKISPEAAALFRIVFGSALLVCFVLTPVGAGSVPAGPQPEDTPWLTRAAGDLFIARPGLADLIGPCLLITGALSIAGAFTRLSFASFTLAALAWGVVIALRYGHHPISAALLAMLCLVPSRWGDAWSVDAWLRRHRPRPAAYPREYGFTVWIPGVVLGLALGAAAAAKFMEGGVDWVLNGSVKYHILTDIEHAPVDWGVRFGLHPDVAVALSFGALAVESLMLPAAFIRHWRVRLAAAIAGAALFVGFWAFHGLFWPWWWILLLAFAPWDRLYARRWPAPQPAPVAAASGTIRLRHVQIAVFVLAVAQQVAASAWLVEVPPMISAYDMYSKTYSSGEEYVRSAAESHWLVASMHNQSMDACRVTEAEARMIASTVVSTSVAGDPSAVLRRCFHDVNAVRTIAVEEARRHVDWATGRYLGTMRVPVAGPLPLPGGDR